MQNNVNSCLVAANNYCINKIIHRSISMSIAFSLIGIDVKRKRYLDIFKQFVIT
jgi:hypothetical protein